MERLKRLDCADEIAGPGDQNCGETPCEEPMEQKHEKSAPECLLSLITSDIDLARVYVAVGRSAFKRGRVNEGEFARLKAMKFYCEALDSLLEIGESEREPFLADLQNLRTKIRWLSMKADASSESSERTAEDSSMDKLLERVFKPLEGKLN